MYLPIVIEAGSPKSGFQQGWICWCLFVGQLFTVSSHDREKVLKGSSYMETNSKSGIEALTHTFWENTI